LNDQLLPGLLTAREAADRLGVKLDTLYAYVSRGRLRSVAVAGTRQRRYRAEEVDALKIAAAGPMSRPEGDGESPIIASAICLIENGRFYYRGRDALALAESETLETVAALLWQGAPAAEGGEIVPAAEASAASGLTERCQIRLAMLADADVLALDLTRSGVIRTGSRIMTALAACVAPTVCPASTSGLPVHRQLAAAWHIGDAGADMLRRCLVLLADHELNASTYVARCVASTGATPYAVVAAALAALSGRRHGGASARAAALFRDIAAVGDPLPLMAARICPGSANSSTPTAIRARCRSLRRWPAPCRAQARASRRPSPPAPG
jgi:citrate synthase